MAHILSEIIPKLHRFKLMDSANFDILSLKWFERIFN